LIVTLTLYVCIIYIQSPQISTPRRFGKTISVSQFAAAMLFAAPQVEISIYSTCKRISQKLLRNVQKFFMLLLDQDPASKGFRVIRQNMEEVVMGGPDGVADVRVVNSYPSKVGFPDQSRPDACYCSDVHCSGLPCIALYCLARVLLMSTI
jgi:hypothetical protein